MPIPGLPVAAYSVSKVDIQGYAGPAIEVYKIGQAGSFTNINFTGINEGDSIDISALETFANGEAVYVRSIYDQSGNSHTLSANVTENDAAFQVCDTLGNAIVDDNGLLIINAISPSQWFSTSTAPLTEANALSVFARVAKNSADESGALFGEPNRGSGFFAAYFDISGGSGIVSGMTNPSMYKNGSVNLSAMTRDDLYTELNTDDNMFIFSLVGAVISGNADIAIMAGRFQVMSGKLQSYIVYTSDETTNRSEVESFLSDYDIPADQFPSGTITNASTGNPVEGANVDFKSMDNYMGTRTFVERVVTGADGIATMTEPYDNTKGYQGEAKWEEEADTGTATGGTDTELTDTSKTWDTDQFGGSEKKFMLKITAGTNSGEERTIISNTADTITVDRAFTAAIDNTSEYEIVELKGGLTEYFPPQA